MDLVVVFLLLCFFAWLKKLALRRLAHPVDLESYRA
jgi:hypothetical protein